MKDNNKLNVLMQAKLSGAREKIEEIQNNIADLIVSQSDLEYKQKLARTQFDHAMVEFEKSKRRTDRVIMAIFVILAILVCSIVALHIRDNKSIEPTTTIVETTTVKAVTPTKPKKKEETTKVETTVAKTTVPTTVKAETTTVKATVPATTKPVTTTKAAPVAEKKSSSTKYYNIPLSKDLQDHVFTLGKKYGIDPKIIFAMIRKESNYNSGAMGDSGRSYGLMQIQKRYHGARMQRLGCTNLLDPYQNITVGVDIFAEGLRSGGGSLDYALMAYNSGPGAAKSYVKRGIVTDYVRIVKSYMNELK